MGLGVLRKPLVSLFSPLGEFFLRQRVSQTKRNEISRAVLPPVRQITR